MTQYVSHWNRVMERMSGASREQKRFKYESESAELCPDENVLGRNAPAVEDPDDAGQKTPWGWRSGTHCSPKFSSRSVSPLSLTADVRWGASIHRLQGSKAISR